MHGDGWSFLYSEADDQLMVVFMTNIFCIFQLYLGEKKIEDNVCSGEVKKKEETARDPIYEEPGAVLEEKIHIGENTV